MMPKSADSSIYTDYGGSDPFADGLEVNWQIPERFKLLCRYRIEQQITTDILEQRWPKSLPIDEVFMPIRADGV